MSNSLPLGFRPLMNDIYMLCLFLTGILRRLGCGFPDN